jgi:hypothetical protein
MQGMPKRICATILSDDSNDDWTESDEDHVEQREGDSESAEDVTSEDDCCNEVGKGSPVTGLEWPRGFQEVKVPRLHNNGTGWW